MNTEELSRRVEAVIVEHLGVRPDQVRDSANFYDDLGIDSLDAVELAMALEDEFEIEIADEELDDTRTVGDLKKSIARQLEERE